MDSPNATPLRAGVTDTSLPLLIARARNSVLKMLEAEMAPLRLSTVQCMILLRLHGGGPNTAGALSRFSGIDSGAMTRLVDRLVAKQLLARTPDAKDRRAVRLVLTDRALALVPTLQDCLGRVHARLVSDGEPADVARVAAFLTGVIDMAGAGPRAGTAIPVL
jgi:DNA-binding MarR family transcriptional regulator